MKLNARWKPLRYHPVQSQLWQYNGRFAVVVAGRRSGKTEICRRKLILKLPIKKPWPDPIYVYLLPTFQQAKRVAWYPIIDMIPKNWIAKNGINKTELSITTVFGSKLYISGADKPERLEGISCDDCIIDESADQKPSLFPRTIVPMLADRNGGCYRIGVPKRTGIGRIQFREAYERGLSGEDGIASFHWKSAEILTPEQIEEARAQLDPVDFAEQFEAQWQNIGSTVYYNFSEDNLSYDVKYDPTRAITVGCDFNVDPMSWTLSHFIDGKFYVFDEIAIRETNTPKTLDTLYNKYYNHLAGWDFYGDASGRARHTSATRSDYLIIKNDARFGQKHVFFPRKNPNIRDRFAAVNRAFKDANGNIRCFINPSCKKLINDLRTVNYEEGTTELEDYEGTSIGHMSDALGYSVHRLLPIKLEYDSMPSVWSSVG